MVANVVIHKAASVITLDSVSFNIAFDKVTIEGGNPSGPVFIYGEARAVVSVADANLLVAAGAIDRR